MKRYKLLLFIVMIMIISFGKIHNIYAITNASEETEQVYVGYSRIKINPDPSNGQIPLAGYGNTQYRLASFEEGEQDFQQDLYATVISIKDHSGKTIIFVTCDLIGVPVSLTKSIRESITQRTGIESDKIMISGTHTHSSPDISFSNSKYQELTNSINKYKELLIENITEACVDAISNLELADIYIGTTDIVNADGSSALNFVRHYMTDGTYKNGDIVYSGDNHGNWAWNGTNWVAVKRISHVSEADTTLQMIKFDRTQGEDILMVNWQAHPTLTGGSAKTTISSDWVGSFRTIVEETCNCQVAYFTGAAGNLNSTTSITDGSEGIKGISYGYNTDSNKSTAENDYDRSMLFGQTLASFVNNAYKELKLVKGGLIQTNQETLDLKVQTNDNQQLLTNANYCSKIWNASWNDIKNMITGNYEWGDSYTFPDGFDKTGAKLREVIQQSSTLSKYFIINGSDTEGYSCELSNDITRSSLNTLIALIGSDFNDRIYSPYHANAVIRNSKYSEDETSSIEINAISIGDLSFVTIPNEIFSTNGKYIKENSSSAMTFILGYTNGRQGYIPSLEAYEYGCYEADTSSFAKGSGEFVAKKLVSMISENNQIATSEEKEESLPDNPQTGQLYLYIAFITLIISTLFILIFRLKKQQQN